MESPRPHGRGLRFLSATSPPVHGGTKGGLGTHQNYYRQAPPVCPPREELPPSFPPCSKGGGMNARYLFPPFAKRGDQRGVSFRRPFSSIRNLLFSPPLRGGIKGGGVFLFRVCRPAVSVFRFLIFPLEILAFWLFGFLAFWLFGFWAFLSAPPPLLLPLEILTSWLFGLLAFSLLLTSGLFSRTFCVARATFCLLLISFIVQAL